MWANDSMNNDTGQRRNDLASGNPDNERLWVAAYLGNEPARELLKAKAPPRFSLQSMRHGGDRNWRTAMRIVGRKPAAFAACEIARAALEIYLEHPDSPEEVGRLAADAVGALTSWKDHPQVDLVTLLVKERCLAFFLAVDVGGNLWRKTGAEGHRLGHIVGHCYGVVLPNNGLYVRSLGEAAENLHRFGLDEEQICRIISRELLSDLLATCR
jgi:hypothetical protein